MTSLPFKIDYTKPIDVVAVGSWTNFDHIFKVDRLPLPGDTVRIINNIHQVKYIYWGGCALNIITAAAKIGAKTGLVTVVGEDFIESGYNDYLKSLGVDVSGIIIINGEYCGHSFLFTDTHGDAICISHIGVSDNQENYEPNHQVLTKSKVVVISYRFDRFTFQAAKTSYVNGCLVIISGNLITSNRYIEEILQTSHIIICTTHELSILLDYINARGDVSFLFEKGIQAVIETRGLEGSIIHTPGMETHMSAILSQSMIDPVGAGDAFTGGVSAGLSFGWSLEKSVQLGSVIASFVVEAVGSQTNQPTLDKARERLLMHGIELPPHELSSN